VKDAIKSLLKMLLKLNLACFIFASNVFITCLCKSSF